MVRRKTISSIAIAGILSLSSAIPILASETKLYQAYVEKAQTHSSSIIRVIDGKGLDGKDSIAYCYDHDKKLPGVKDGDESEKTYYTKIESYLDSDDYYTEKYGKEKKKRIAAALVAGYPLDTYGLVRKYGISKDKANYLTQTLIWDINENNDNEMSPYGEITPNMAQYYNEMLKHSKVDKFEQGKLSLQGKMEFVNRGSYWSTDNLSAVGSKGSFSISNLPDGMEVRDFNNDQPINGDIKVGQEFYIVSKDKPSENLKLKIRYKYQEVKLYFYKYYSGGIFENIHDYQNLVRGELSDKINETQLEIKNNGDFEKPELPSIGGTTPSLPGEEGTRPELPGDSGLGGVTPGLPGEEGTRPELPGDSGLGGITPSLPGEEGTRPELPGDSGLGGITPGLPGEEGTRPELPGDSGLGGITPGLPGEEGTRPELPGDSGLGGITPGLPGEEGTRPELPGDSGLGGITPGLPGEEGTRPELPGDSGLGGVTPGLPGEEGTRPELPGESGEAGAPEAPGLGGTTPSLPGEEGTRPELPGESGEAEAPEVPDKEESKPELPSGSGDVNKPETTDKVEKPMNSSDKNNENPKTGDSGMIGYLGLGALSMAGLLIARRKMNI